MAKGRLHTDRNSNVLATDKEVLFDTQKDRLDLFFNRFFTETTRLFAYIITDDYAYIIVACIFCACSHSLHNQTTLEGHQATQRQHLFLHSNILDMVAFQPD